MASLTPAELAALLGPAEARSVAKSQAVLPAASADTSSWRRFTESFSRAVTARLRPLVRSAVRVTFQSSRVVGAGAVQTAHDVRSMVGWWQSQRTMEPLALVLAPSLISTFVDRLLGGRTTADPDDSCQQQQLTEVDQRLAARLIDAVRHSFQESIPPELADELSDLTTSDMTFREAWLSDCELRQVSFELRFIQGGGRLDVVVPLETSTILADPAAKAEQEILPTATPAAVIAAPRISVLAVRTPQTKLLAEELASLTVGDVLLTDIPADQSLDVLVDGRLRFQAQAGTQRGHRAVRILDPADRR